MHAQADVCIPTHMCEYCTLRDSNGVPGFNQVQNPSDLVLM